MRKLYTGDCYNFRRGFRIVFQPLTSKHFNTKWLGTLFRLHNARYAELENAGSACYCNFIRSAKKYCREWSKLPDFLPAIDNRAVACDVNSREVAPICTKISTVAIIIEK